MSYSDLVSYFSILICVYRLEEHELPSERFWLETTGQPRTSYYVETGASFYDLPGSIRFDAALLKAEPSRL